MSQESTDVAQSRACFMSCRWRRAHSRSRDRTLARKLLRWQPALVFADLPSPAGPRRPDPPAVAEDGPRPPARLRRRSDVHCDVTGS